MNSIEQPMSDMSVSKQTLVSPELDWSAKKLTHSTIQYQKVNVINGVNSATINSNSTQGAFSFQIPAKVLSLKDSFVAMDLSLTYPSGTAVLDGNLGNIFSRVVITADNGVVLADINDFHRYSSMLVPASTQYDDVCDGTFSGADTFETSSLAVAQTIPFSNIQKSNNNNLNGGYVYDGAVPPVASLSPAVNRQRGATTTSHAIDPNVGSLRHLVMAESITTAGYASYQFRLKDLLPYTICALDQLLYFGGSQIQFDFYLNGIDYIGYKASTPALGASIASLTSVAMSNFSFFLATETNVKTIDTIIQKVKNEGVRLKIPYVYGSKTSISASTSQSVNQVITRTAGARLLWVAYAAYLTTSTADLVNSHPAGTFSTYTTTMDNINIKSQSPISVDRGEQWLYNRRELKGSCVRGVFDTIHDFVDFTSYIGKPLCSFDVSVEDGLPLEENHTWGITATTTSTALTHFIYYCMSRELVLQNFSVQVV
jgi:hypothetical protein